MGKGADGDLSSYRTNVSVHHQPFVIAVAMIYLAADFLQRDMGTSPPWYTFFDTTLEQILDVKDAMMWMYRATPPKYIPHTRGELEDYLVDAKKFIEETDADAKSAQQEHQREQQPSVKRARKQ